MSNILAGKIHSIADTQQVTESFKKRDFIIAVKQGDYVQHVKLQATQARCELLNEFQAGDVVEINYNIRGRLFTSKATGKEDAITTLEAWKITLQARGNNTVTYSSTGVPSFPKSEPEFIAFGGNVLDPNDLPF